MSAFDAAELAGRRVLLTGAAGFIGARLGRRLLDAGADVHATSRRVRPAGEPNLHWHQLDLADAPAVSEMVETVRPEIILHLASHVAGSRDLDLVLPTFQANLASTVYLLEAAARLDGLRRFVLTGSLEENDEEPLAVPASPYAAAKAAAASYLRLFAGLYDMPVAHARLFMVYGPGQRDLKKLVPYVILARLRGEDLELSSGVRPVDWVFVDDVVEGLLRVAVDEAAVGQRVDLGNGELVTVREVVERLCEIVEGKSAPRFGALGDRPLEQVRKAETGQTQRLLGWKPATPLADGLAATVDFYRRELEAGRLS